MKLQEAKDIKLGTTSVSKIMLGTTQVWPKQDNNHLLYGEVVDPTHQLPTISLDDTVNTPTLDASNNMFYLDNWSNAAPTKISFDNKINIKSINKLKLDTSNVTSMILMFNECASLTSLDLSSFNTSKVTNISGMFSNCSSLTSLDLSSFNTSKVTNISRMFEGCSSLTSLDLSNFNISKVSGFDRMFFGCSSLTTLDLSNWDASNITSTHYMFSRCSSLKDVYITEESTLNKLTNDLKSQGSNYIPTTATIHYNYLDYKYIDNKWTIVDDNNHVLYGEVVDASQPLPTISLNDTVNTSKLDAANNMFYLDTWSTVVPTSISFDNKSNIKTIKKLKGLDTSNVTDMSWMFFKCSSLKYINLSNFNTLSVTDMTSMFSNCSSLTKLDLSKFKTSNVTSMSTMFSNCSSLTSLDLSNWDTSNVTDIEYMFNMCASLKDVYITSSATLNKLTNNLRSAGSNYIPGTATIHYNDIDYHWAGCGWTNIIIEV